MIALLLLATCALSATLQYKSFNGDCGDDAVAWVNHNKDVINVTSIAQHGATLCHTTVFYYAEGAAPTEPSSAATTKTALRVLTCVLTAMLLM